MRWVVVVGDFEVTDTEYTYIGPFRTYWTADRRRNQIENALRAKVADYDTDDLFVSVRKLLPADTTIAAACDPWVAS